MSALSVTAASQLYRPAGWALPFWAVGIVFLMTALLFLSRVRSERVAGAVRTASYAASWVGAAIAFLFLVVEAGVFGMRLPLCWVSAVGLGATLLWVGRRVRRGRRIAASFAGLLLGGICTAYLFSHGGLPTASRLLRGPAQKLVLRTDSHTRGANGGVLIVEFADFECMACRLQEEALDRMAARYRGRVLYAYRHLPLRRHAFAAMAANASECAAAQGRFWEAQKYLLRNQEDLPAAVRRLPAEAGLDARLFEQCVAEERYRELVRADAEDAKALGIHGTPSLVIGDHVFTGVFTPEKLAAILDQEQSRTAFAIASAREPASRAGATAGGAKDPGGCPALAVSSTGCVETPVKNAP